MSEANFFRKYSDMITEAEQNDPIWDYITELARTSTYTGNYNKIIQLTLKRFDITIDDLDQVARNHRVYNIHKHIEELQQNKQDNPLESADYTDMQYGGKPITKDSRPFEKAVAGKERSINRNIMKGYTPTDNDYYAGYRADKEKRRAQEKPRSLGSKK
jgi:hypothetical protein